MPGCTSPPHVSNIQETLFIKKKLGYTRGVGLCAGDWVDCCSVDVLCYNCGITMSCMGLVITSPAR